VSTEIPCLIFDDPRSIRAIWFAGKKGDGYTTQYEGGKIVAYRENGQMDHVPYFAVYDRFDVIIARVPAGMVSVVYEV
jgi:hypothetical protein